MYGERHFQMKPKILIVEDEAIIAADIAGKLGRLGYEIAGTAMRGPEAVALAHEHRPDVVLMDIHLIGPMDGIEVAERIRECDLPVIYLTAHSDVATLERAKLSGPFGYILKPFDERDLQTQIEMACLRHQTEQALRDSEEQLRLTNTELARHVDELRVANSEIRTARRAALNLMEDALIARRQAEETSVELRREVTERKKAEAARERLLVEVQRQAAELSVHQLELQTQNEELRTAQVELETSRRKFADLYHFAPLGYFTLDSNGLILEVNLAGANLLGMDKQTLLQKPFSLFISDPHDRDVLTRHRKTTFTTRNREECDLRLKREDGSVFYAHLQSIAVENDDGKAGCIRTAVMDISERKHAEETRSRLSAIVESSEDAISSTDMEGILKTWNKGAEKIYGHREGEIIGKHVSILFPEQRAHEAPMIFEKMGRGESIERLETERLRKDGTSVPVSITLSPVKDSTGKVVAVSAITRDITVQKRAEAKLHKEHREIAMANRILEVFVKETGGDLYDKALDIVLEGMKSRHGVFGYIDEQGVLVCPTLSRMFDQCEMEGKCIYYTRDKWKGLWSRALLEKKTLYSNKPARVPDGHVPIRNNMATPILFHGDVIGLINLANKETDFTGEDQECLETISNTIAPVLFAWIQKELREKDRKQAEEKLVRLNGELEKRVKERTAELAVTIDTLQNEVADRRKAEDALRESQKSLKKAQEIAHIGSWHYDLRTRKMTWSDELYGIFGLDPAVFDGDLNAVIRKAIHSEERYKIRRGIRQILSNSKAEPMEYNILLPEGGVRTVWAEGEAVFEGPGNAVGMIGTVQDITERKRAEEQIVRLAAAVESAADGIVITENGAIRYINSAFEKMTGYTRDEVMDRDLHLFDSGHHGESFFQRLRETLKKDGVWTGRLTNKKKDGTLYEEECTYAPIRGRSGEILNYIAIKRDVTEKVRLESIAQAVDTMNNIGYIFSGVRHEIGNPVTTIAISLNLLMKKMEALDRPTMEKHIKRCIEEIDKVDYLLRCLKNFNMFEQLEPRDIVLSEFMNKLMALVKEDFAKKGISILAVVEPEDANAHADPRALQQVLLNLFTNAADALVVRVDPKITVTVKKAKMIRIRVEDNGCGIPANTLQNVFKPFYTTKAHGTGLGLMIVRKMIVRMNGALEITSIENEGTVVDISIPCGS